MARKAQTQRKHPRVTTPVIGESMTKQTFKDEVNINKIMEKFQKTGAITHYAKYAPEYGDATPCELHDALQIVAKANNMFEELPATIRAKFDNDPEKFLAFVQDEKNADEMIELGLRERESSPIAAEKIEAALDEPEPEKESSE